MTAKFSGPLSHNSSVYLNLKGVLNVLNALTDSANESWFALKKEVDTVGVLPAIKAALSLEPIAFAQLDRASPAKSQVPSVEAVVSTNSPLCFVSAHSAINDPVI